MATQDNGSGLLAKVARFVLNPTVDWVDIDKPGESPAVGDRGKQALKQMIERKQYNDAVRKREFDKLRKLRRNAVPVIAGVTVPASAFQDSWGYSVYEERANTLKKIDEIEAQMSKQWWKGREPPAPAAAVNPRVDVAASQPQPGGMDSAFATTMPSDMEDSQGHKVTLMGVSGGLAAGSPVSLKPDFPHVGKTLADPSLVPALSPAAADQSLADPRLEEAAIRFANSDDGGAEAVLLGALQTPDVAPELARSWSSALLDLYRATGQMASYQRIASDYAQRFACAVPVWIAPVQNFSPIASLSEPESLVATVRQAIWRCPPLLDAAAVLHLQAAVQEGSEPFWLDWRALKTITPQAAQVLAALLAHWCERPLKLYLENVDVLDQMLRLHTPMGDTGVEQFWWRLRLDLLRVLRLQDDFDLVALDFCVTYEISPPSWLPARCQRLDVESIDAQTESGQLPDSTLSSEHALATPGDDPVLVLKGELLGDASPVLQSLQAAMVCDRLLVVGCSDLIRVDFSAAGSILNWMANAQAQGCRIELRDVPYLVGVFFHLIGIDEHARIIHRTH